MKKVSDKSKLNTATVDNLIKYRSIIRLGDLDILSSYNNLYNSLSINSLISKEDNLKQDDNFNYCLSLKAKDGLGKFIYDNKYISIFSGLLPINKSDIVGIEVYDAAYNTYICKFIIDKKYATICKYIRYLSLI